MFFKTKIIKGKKYLYLVENKRVDGKVKQAWQLYVGTPKQVYEKMTQPGKDIEVLSSSYGKASALLAASEKINLINIVNRHVKRRDQKGLTPGEYLFLLIAGRSENALSRKQMRAWFRKSSLRFIFHPKHQLSSQNCLNYMKRFDADTITKIEQDIAKELVEQGYTPTKLLLDTTNTFTYIQKGENIPKKGNSKQKRFDKNLVGLGLVTTDSNIAFISETYPGNRSDAKVFVDIFNKLCQRLELLNVDKSGLVIVIDRGFNSKDNVTNIVNEMHLIGGLKRNQVSDLMKLSIDQYGVLYKNKKGYNVYGIRCAKKEVFGKEFTVILTFNERTYKRQKLSYEIKKKKIMEAVEEMKKKANRKGRGRKLTQKGINVRLVKLIPDCYRAIFNYEILATDGHTEIRFEVNQEKERKLYNSFGKSAIFTDLEAWSDADIVKTYFSRSEIEEDFKWMNNRLVIPITPVNVRKDLTIRAHIFICIMGLLLYRITQNELDMDMSLQKLAQTLAEIRIAVVKGEGRKTSIIVEKMGANAAKIFSKLNLARFLPTN